MEGPGLKKAMDICRLAACSQDANDNRTFNRRSQGVHVHPQLPSAPPAANVQVSTEYCSSLTDKTFNT
jgi:hypothetical protein